jgi:hypothetical protein
MALVDSTAANQFESDLGDHIYLRDPDLIDLIIVPECEQKVICNRVQNPAIIAVAGLAEPLKTDHETAKRLMAALRNDGKI